MQLNAWILTIGNEILNGVITDTNRETISRELRSLGIPIVCMSSVGDDVEAICDALELAMQRAKVTIVSGGLGPTEDDKTAASAAQFVGRPLKLNEEQMERIENRFKIWNRPMAQSNTKQALLPEGSDAIPNDWGTAPGFAVEKNGAMALFFPGIPAEMINMLRNYGAPMIFKKFGASPKLFGSRTLIVYGISESKLGEILQDISKDVDDYHLAFLPRFPVIRLRIDVSGALQSDIDLRLLEKVNIIAERLKENMLSDYGAGMEQTVLDILKDRKLTLTLAESITGGMIGQMLTGIPGSSSNFMGSIVSYSNEMKVDTLDVKKTTLDTHGAVSHQCAKEMAIGAKRVGKSDIGLSITGIAGPDGGSEAKPVGTFFVGLATPETIISRGFLYPGSRDWTRTIAAMQSLDLLRRHYLGYRIHGTEDSGE